MTFQEAEKKLNGRASKRVGVKTYLERCGLNCISVRYHATNVVMIHRDGRYTLNSGLNRILHVNSKEHHAHF